MRALEGQEVYVVGARTTRARRTSAQHRRNEAEEEEEPGYGKNGNAGVRSVVLYLVGWYTTPTGSRCGDVARDDGVGSVRGEVGSLTGDGKRISTTPGQLLAGAALILLLTLATACGLLGPDTGAGRPVDAEEASGALREIEVAPPASMAGYSRERFPHWSDAEEFGWDAPSPSCDVRDAALIRDAEYVQIREGCDVISGRWPDPYTGRTYDEPSEIDIDHVVPLAEAWRSGASSWDERLRERYANDPDVLLSVEDNANQSKGDKGPGTWRPPNEAAWCDYATRWISIKAKYDLSAGEREKEALEEMLGTCAEGG